MDEVGGGHTQEAWMDREHLIAEFFWWAGQAYAAPDGENAQEFCNQRAESVYNVMDAGLRAWADELYGSYVR
jgi:hypothetical protein